MKRSRKTHSSRSRRKRLSIQHLESRKMMAADIALVDTTLSIQGSSMDDVAEVYVDSEALIVKVSSYDESGQIVSAISDTYSANDVGRIVFEGSQGDDLLVNDSAIPAVARGGEGNDTLMGGSGDDVLVGGVGDDMILSGGGNCDIVVAGPGENVIVGSVDNTASEAPAAEQAEPVDVADASSDANDATVDDAVEVVAEENPIESEQLPDNAVDQLQAVSVEGVDVVENNVDPLQASEEESEADSMRCELEQAETEAESIESISEDDPTDVAPLLDEPIVETNQVDETNLAGEPTPEHEAEPLPTETVMDASETVEQLDTIDIPQTQASDAVGLDIEDIDTPADDPIEEPGAEDAQVTGEVEDADDQSEAAAGEPESDDDVIFGGSGADWLFGENGNDTIFGDSSPLDDALMRGVISGRFRI